jgi:aspartate-semialdehyde dehydrogenase
MPGVDGTLSTRMIRFLEKEQAQTKRYAASSSSHGSSNGRSRQRVPILAVGASLQEDKRFDYLQAGYVLHCAQLIWSLILIHPQIRWLAPQTNRLPKT